MFTVDPLVLRFLERLICVVIGGMTIYLGYRLFLSLPDYRDSAGKFVLPLNTSVVVARVGPGVFFALFGSVAVAISLLRPLQIEGEKRVYAGTAPTNSSDVKADARALLRRDMAVLNTIPRHLSPDLSSSDRKDLSEGIRRVKLALMKPVWGETSEGFGDFTEFEEWVVAEERNNPPAMQGALSLYRYGANP
jgi:hypothetical protein